MPEDLDQRFDLLKREVDALQVSVMGHSKPWYRNVSTLLSITALLFSFGTTFVSYRRANVQDIQSARQELRGLLQRISALPKENVELGKKFPDDPASRNMVAGFINQENTLLARNAAEIAKKLPVGSVSPTEYYAIAGALQTAYDLAGANEFLTLAIKANPDFSTEISSLRMIANMKFIEARPEAGRVEYQKALDIFSKFPQYDPYTRAMTNVLTELAWAFSEASTNAFPLATQHIESAEAILAPLPRSPGVDMLRAQVAQAKAQLYTGQPLPVGVPPQITAAATPSPP